MKVPVVTHRNGELRSLLGLGFLFWLAVHAIVGGIRVAQPLLSAPGVWQSLQDSLDVRRRRTLDARDRALGRPAGFSYELVAAVAENVPEHETVYATGLTSRKDAQILVPVHTLCFPRVLAWAPARLTSDWEELADSYLLTFDATSADCARGRKEALARGRGWTLWR